MRQSPCTELDSAPCSSLVVESAQTKPSLSQPPAIARTGDTRRTNRWSGRANMRLACCPRGCLSYLQVEAHLHALEKKGRAGRSKGLRTGWCRGHCTLREIEKAKAELGRPNAGKPRAYRSIGRHDQGGFKSRDEWPRTDYRVVSWMT